MMLLPNWIDARWLRRFRKRIVEWYALHGRSLPWRDTSSGYAIWVSEIMLQQTQVATVVPYYARFLERFESVAALAEAPESEVLMHWEGLGYYRRARQMHAAARLIVEQHQARFPTTFDDVLALPGIGRYTAGAICSFAYDQPTPIVEANTQRLYARLLRLTEPLAAKSSLAALWAFAEQILPKKSGRAINQAAMELGALVCQPKPRCDVCPLQELCPTFADRLQAEIPLPKKRMIYESRSEVALIVANARRQYWIRQCGPDEWWSGLWDFPRFEILASAENQSLTEEVIAQAKIRFGLDCQIESSLFSVQHSVTRYRITLTCYAATLDLQGKGRVKAIDRRHSKQSGRWVSLKQLESIPLSASGRQVAERLAKSEGKNNRRRP